MLIINKKYKLHKATCYKDKSNTRPPLNNVFIDGKDMVATTGYILARVEAKRDNEMPKDPVLIPAKAFEEATKKNWKFDAEIDVFENTAKVYLDGSLNGIELPLDKESTFPDWKRTIPTGKPMLIVGINVKLLADLCAALGTSEVTLEFGDTVPKGDGIRYYYNAIVVRPYKVEERREADGLIMPIRTDPDSHGWKKEDQQKEENNGPESK